MINTSGSVRVDLLGGTLDIPPIHLILANAFTLNLATSLKANVKIKPIEGNKIIINSLDYDSTNEFLLSDFNSNNFNTEFFGPLKFIAFIIHHFNLRTGYQFDLTSGSPTGAGLGGSSSMGVVLFKSLCELTKTNIDNKKIIEIVRGYESIILNKGPAGYQDYYPALFGGILALKPSVSDVHVEQLFDKKLADILEKRITLIYSGETRLSGINNWEVYKGFFDGDKTIHNGLNDIAKLSYDAYQAIKKGHYSELISLISIEGAKRKELFPGIVSPKVETLYNNLKSELTQLGMKVCGAGGGGCFLLLHKEDEKEKILNEIKLHPKMKVLNFEIDPPLN